ncbi:TnsD family Tn7-like transposition protein [Paenibacillus sp. DR312]|uniref:TnsD family Tn7-like transposition protein n=1 Tax=unclassified Paenibacillus TaxID=185978 RepID=UPI001C981257|nr:TnsD family Tn7-like transposition protein [Paenibacillus sp. DR312]QZN76180.1 TnsD family transposase [Paenibacillus sp. DR312]
MMLQFPIPYEDELLYSLLARVGIRSGNISHRAILKDIFGMDSFTAGVELQPGISNIVTNLPAGSTISSDQLIVQNTMYLFYTAFRDEEQAHAIYVSMLDEHGRDLHNAIGLMSSAIKPHTHFQYCVLCNQLDMERHGEYYWRRIHQISGVRICIKHGIWLSESSVLMRERTKYAFIAPTQDNCSNRSVREIIDKELLSQYSCIMNNIEKLLNYKFPHRPMEWFHKHYINQLMRKGYASNKGRTNYKRLRAEFVDFYGVELLEILQSSANGESSWLKLIFQKHRKGFHPVRHLLVMQFLGLTLDELFNSEPSDFLDGHASKGSLPKRKIMKKTMTEEHRRQAKRERREAWLRMRSQHPGLGRLELRKLNPKVYAWLYLYDREFLMNHMPEKLPPKAGATRHDWEKRDMEILEEVTGIAEQLMSEGGKPRRITLKRIQEILGRKCLMPKHLKKLPRTRTFLEQVVEDAEAFQKRRVLWAIGELKSNDESLTLNQIKIKAGVSNVKHIIEEFEFNSVY